MVRCKRRYLLRAGPRDFKISNTCSPRGILQFPTNMAAIVRQCSRITFRGLTAFSLRSRPVQQAVLSPLLRKNLKVGWKVDLSPKYFCSYTQNIIDNANPDSAASSGQTGHSDVGATSSESDDSELISSSSNDLYRISQRLGSVRHEETLLQAFQVIKNAEGIF